MKASLDDRIARATDLALTHPAAAGLLNFYRELALFQKPIFEELRASGQNDIRVLPGYFPALLNLVKRTGTKPLADFRADDPLDLLLAEWEGQGSDEAGRFYARTLLQPYAEHLALRGTINLEQTTSTCPFCNARPVAGVLRGEGDGARRWLLCSLCSTEWPFLRAACPNCGERDKDLLPVYTAEGFAHVRVEACDRCKTYIKSIDLTRDGHAVPVVDELATIALNLWADEHGYTKLESNLLGL
ncbi:MAG: formate dehydrogenase accessory protein FdhE [Bryobacteraceae bacterium]|jgi:FdhE protein